MTTDERLALAAGILGAAALVTDIATPLGFAAGTLYVVPTALLAHTRKPRWIIVGTIVALLLILLGWYLSFARVSHPWIVVSNRSLSICAVVGCALVGARAKWK